MFGRFFLLVISIVSIAWIFFIGYDLLNKKDNVSPQFVFTKTDGEILIVNRSAEVLLEDLNSKIHPEIESFFKSLLQNVVPNERLFVAEKRPILIVESPNIWTKNGVKRYFETKGVKIEEPKKIQFQLPNGLEVVFKKNHMLISKGKPKLQQALKVKEENWPLWDNKASASIIFLENPLKSTNIYFKANGTVSYQTKYGPVLDCKKVDDRDLFAQYLPVKLEKYHFFEKEFAKKSLKIEESSPLYQWADEGFVEFEYMGVKCLMSDYNKLIDPMNILDSDRKANRVDNLSNQYKGVQLSKNFPSANASSFYIGKVSDKVIMSEKKEILEKVIGDYELGNTLALSKEPLEKLYGKMPKRVSERNAANANPFSLSSFKNLLIKTYFLSEQSPADVLVDNKKTSVNNNSFAYSGKVIQYLGNGNVVYCITNQSEVIAVSNKKQLWKVKLEGELIGNAKLIDLNENGNLQLLLNTNEKIYLLNNAGANVNDFPYKNSFSNAVSYYRWANKTNFLAISTNNELIHLDEKGRQLKKVKLSISNIKNEIDVFKNGAILAALVTGDTKTQVIDLVRYRNTKNPVILPLESIQLKVATGFYYFSISPEGLLRYDQNGNKTLLHKGKIENLQKIYKGKNTLIAFSSQNTIYVVNEAGNIGQTINTNVAIIDDFDFITIANGNQYFAVIDGIENNIFLLDSKANILNEKPFEGKTKVKLSIENGKINITSLIENYIVQYYDVLN